MFAFSYVVNFFANKFSCLGGWRPSLARIFSSSLYGFPLGHGKFLLPEV
jgi:hypothetical protein